MSLVHTPFVTWPYLYFCTDDQCNSLVLCASIDIDDWKSLFCHERKGKERGANKSRIGTHWWIDSITSIVPEQIFFKRRHLKTSARRGRAVSIEQIWSIRFIELEDDWLSAKKICLTRFKNRLWIIMGRTCDKSNSSSRAIIIKENDAWKFHVWSRTSYARTRLSTTTTAMMFATIAFGVKSVHRHSFSSNSISGIQFTAMG